MTQKQFHTTYDRLRNNMNEGAFLPWGLHYAAIWRKLSELAYFDGIRQQLQMQAKREEDAINNRLKMQTKTVAPLEFIKMIRDSFDGSMLAFTAGSCVQLSRILCAIFPGAELYFSDDKRHAITKIGGLFYDIGGLVDDVSTYKLSPDHLNSELYNSTFSINYCLERVAEVPARITAFREIESIDTTEEMLQHVRKWQ